MTKHKKKSSNINQEVQQLLSDLDSDMVGVATLDDIKNTKLEEQALKLLPAVRSIVVMAMEIFPEFLELTSQENVTGAANLYDLYNHHVDILAGKLNKAAYDVARASRQSGSKALPLPSRHTPTDRRSLRSIISYKHAAEAAGLGRIGMSSLLVTHRFGPRVRLSLCLTEASLQSTAYDDPHACRFCNICVFKCPAHALDLPNNNEPYVINKFACQAYLNATGGCSECMRQCTVASPKEEQKQD